MTLLNYKDKIQGYWSVHNIAIISVMVIIVLSIMIIVIFIILKYYNCALFNKKSNASETDISLELPIIELQGHRVKPKGFNLPRMDTQEAVLTEEGL